MADAELMGPASFRPAAPKPRMTIYFTLLIIALCAMLTACIFLYMVVRTFGGFGAVQGRVTHLQRSVSHSYLTRTSSFGTHLVRVKTGSREA